MSIIEFTVNGQKCSVDARIPRDTTLNAYLRYHLALPGTKSMCHQGSCGACIVAVRGYNHTTCKVETFSINSCLVLVFACQGWDITTIEGLGNKRAGYHPIQKRTAGLHATQCGYCTSGWEMHLYSLLDKNLTMAEMEDCLSSNTCRCTGYRPILDTFKSFATDASAELCDQVRDIEDLHICEKTQTICERRCSTSSDGSDWSIIDELTIPPQDTDIIDLHFGIDETEKYFKVYNEDQIYQLLLKFGLESYILVDGNTAKAILGMDDCPRHMIDIRDVKSLKQCTFDQNMKLGANISIEDCITIFKDVAKSKPEFAYLDHCAKHSQMIAHMAVRKNASLAGNMMIKHRRPAFASDIFVKFATLDATVTIKHIIYGWKKELSMLEFLKHDMRGVLIMSFNLPPLSRSHVFRSYKIAPRAQNASAIVNAGFSLKISPKNIVECANIVYGNMSECFAHADRTEKYLVGKNIFSNAVLQGAINILKTELVPTNDPAKPSPDCRKKLAIGLFYKFILGISPKGYPSPRLRSGGFLLERPCSNGKQDYQTNPSLYPITKPVQKYEGLIQSSGEARYVNDLPPMKNDVYGAFVLSTVHNAEIKFIDPSEALKMDGVLAMYTAKDFTGVNSFALPGSILHQEEEEILASKKILFCGQPLAIIVAISEALATKAATKVVVTYTNVSSTSPVLTIDDAKKDSKRLIHSDLKIEPKGRGSNVAKVIKGVIEYGAQYHYYLEPLSCVVVPVDGRLDVYDSSQWVDITQNTIARCLNMKTSDIFVAVRRVGGGFGGKLTRNAQVATACAMVASKMNRPCRIILPLKTNLTIAGRRQPSQIEYEVGVDNIGKIQYLDASMIEDKGCSINDNILSYALSAFPNCYNKDYFNVKTSIVKTDLPCNTAFRAPGTLEGIAGIEHIMEHIAFTLNKDPTDVRLVNMRSEDNDLPELIETLKKKCDYDGRHKEIQQFNKANRWVKKAISLSVMEFPVIYLGNYSAIVSIYREDGSVTVTTGGVEVGQGLYTKVQQVVAYELGVSIDLVTVLPYITCAATNNFFTGGSITSECVCYAASKACKTLKNRLKPFSETSNVTWVEIIKQASGAQVDLVAEYMMSEKEPDLAAYSAFAAASLEGELDVVTGKYILTRLDIIEDVGVSLSPGIDIGQIEGAYVQGLSYYTAEKFLYSNETGKLLTNDAMSYIVDLAKDIPIQMNVTLKHNSKNPKGAMGTKAVGEMGICLENGVLHVLRQCIMESRRESGYDSREWIISVYHTRLKQY